MKRITLAWLLLCTMLSFAQRETDTVWKSQVNQVFKGLDLKRVPHGILLDYAMEFTNVPAYNGILSDSMMVDVDVMGKRHLFYVFKAKPRPFNDFINC